MKLILIMCSLFFFFFFRINFLPIKLFNEIDVNIVFKVKYFIVKSRFTRELIKINYELK
jgi:hypothetical protein